MNLFDPILNTGEMAWHVGQLNPRLPSSPTEPSSIYSSASVLLSVSEVMWSDSKDLTSWFLKCEKRCVPTHREGGLWGEGCCRSVCLSDVPNRKAHTAPDEKKACTQTCQTLTAEQTNKKVCAPELKVLNIKVGFVWISIVHEMRDIMGGIGRTAPTLNRTSCYELWMMTFSRCLIKFNSQRNITSDVIAVVLANNHRKLITAGTLCFLLLCKLPCTLENTQYNNHNTSSYYFGITNIQYTWKPEWFICNTFEP